jgi:hypothetical protein
MLFEDLAFGSIKVDGVEYDYDIVLDRGEIRKRKKGPSKEFRRQFGHTPLSTRDEIPWHCSRLLIGTGMYGRLEQEAKRREVELLLVPTENAIALLNQQPSDTNAVLHLTC